MDTERDAEGGCYTLFYCPSCGGEVKIYIPEFRQQVVCPHCERVSRISDTCRDNAPER